MSFFLLERIAVVYAFPDAAHGKVAKNKKERWGIFFMAGFLFAEQSSELGAKLSLLVPKNMQNAARDICWKSGLVAKVNIGSFDVNLTL